MTTLDDRLGAAYALDQHQGNRAGAVALLRAVDNNTLAEMRVRQRELSQIVAARSVGNICACHVSAVVLGLLNEALT